MAETKKSDPSPQSSSSSLISRSVTPYLIAAFIAAGAMGWYFFVLVPGQFNYFVGSRFRILAVATGQTSTKIQNLRSALNLASIDLGTSDDLKKYVNALVPQVRISEGGPPSPGLVLTLDQEKFCKNIVASISWDEVMTRARTVSDGYFDDLILAKTNGDVVWQREKTTPRIGNLQELLAADNISAGWLPISWSWAVRTTLPKVTGKEEMPKTAALKAVNLNGQPSYLMIQATAAPPDQYFVAAVVSSKALQNQAMHIPAIWVVLFALPVALLFLALPFVKLATLTSKERYGFSDVVMMVVAAIIASGLGAILPFVPSSVNDEADCRLASFADEIETRVTAETREILTLADIIQKNRSTIEEKLQDCDVKVGDKPQNRCHLWTAMDALKLSEANLELDVVVWVNSSGDQTLKWSTKRQVTGNTSHFLFRHFADIKAGHTWKLPHLPKLSRFTIDPVRSPTTSDMGFIFAVPSNDKTHPEDMMFLLNVRPRSVVDTVLPPGYGFAILTSDTGRVQFHSEDGLSLEEDFFQEVGDSDGVREKVQSGRTFTWTENYHGRQHRLHMRPFKKFENSPWQIVTFQELDPLLGAEFQRQTDVFWLGCFSSLLLTAAALLFWAILRWRHQEVRDVVMSAFSLHARDARSSWMSLVFLGVLTVLAAAALFATRLEGAQHWLNALYVFFLLLPLISIAACVASRRIGPRAKQAPEPGNIKERRSKPAGSGKKLVTECLLLVLLIGAAPAAGFKRIVYRLEKLRETERWLEAVHRGWLDRELRLQDRMRPSYEKSFDLIAKGFARPLALGSPKDYSYVSVLPGVSQEGMRTKECFDPWSGQRFVRWLLESWTDTSGGSRVYSIRTADNTLRLQRDSKQLTLGAGYPVGDADYSWLNLSLGIGILIAVAFGISWATGKLQPRTFARSLDLQAQIDALDSDRNEGILLLGPPRTNKDTLVERTLQRTGERMKRIRLLDEALDDAFIKQKAKEIRELAASPWPDRLAMLAGSDSSNRKPRVWIHLSNLESHLTTIASRAKVIQLLEKLLERRHQDEPARVLVVTSSADPIDHFKEIFEQERELVYKDAVPEVELSQSALLLSRFSRSYVSLGDKRSADVLWKLWRRYRPERWFKTAMREVRGCPPLKRIPAELKESWKDSNPSADELAQVIQNRARAYYELIWASSTRSEKLVLIQLAQEGLLNPRSREIVTELVGKGLIVECPAPAIFNYTFRSFLRGIERNQIVQQWERMEGNGLWVIAGKFIGSSLLAGGLFYLLTQDFSVQSLLPVISGTGIFGVPLVRNLIARMSGKADAASA